MEAPAAYQNGPLMPYWYATVEDWSSVAAQVQAETMAAAVRPVFITRPAVLNHSEVCDTPKYRSSILVSSVITIAKTAPKPTTMNQPQDSSSTSPIVNPSITPAAWAASGADIAIAAATTNATATALFRMTCHASR